MAAASPDDLTHFGHRSVRRGDKAGLVRGVFDSVAGRYDLMNDLMSGGLHRVWKRLMVDWLAPRPDWVVLDVAGGTGDIAFRIRERQGPGAGRVVVCDINAEMESVGRDRSLDRGLAGGLAWVVGDAEKLPVASNSVDAYTCAFGYRNMTDPAAALAEARRVLKPGGRFLCLEFSQVRNPVLAKAYDRYSFSVLPRLGKRVAGDEEAYRYLAESIRRFPKPDHFAAMMRQAGLGRVDFRRIHAGIVALHSGWRL